MEISALQQKLLIVIILTAALHVAAASMEGQSVSRTRRYQVAGARTPALYGFAQLEIRVLTLPARGETGRDGPCICSSSLSPSSSLRSRGDDQRMDGEMVGWLPGQVVSSSPTITLSSSVVKRGSGGDTARPQRGRPVPARLTSACRTIWPSRPGEWGPAAGVGNKQTRLLL